MRLVDADKQNELLERMIPTDKTEHEIVFSFETIRNLIENSPTIEAIPVEWLREKMQSPQMTCANPFGFVLAEWLDEQEAR